MNVNTELKRRVSPIAGQPPLSQEEALKLTGNPIKYRVGDTVWMLLPYKDPVTNTKQGTSEYPARDWHLNTAANV